MPRVFSCLSCLLAFSSLGLGTLGTTDALDGVAIIQTGMSKGKQQLYSDAYIQQISDRESAKALELALGAMKKMGADVSKVGQTSNFTVKRYTQKDADYYDRKQNATIPSDMHNDKGDSAFDYVFQATPLIGVKPTEGNWGPYFELRLPKIGCDLKSDKGRDAIKNGGGTWTEYFKDKWDQCFADFDTMKTKIQLFIGVKTKAGDLIYVPIDANSRAAEIGIGGYFPVKERSTQSKPWNPNFYFYTGLFHQHVLAIDGKAIPPVFFGGEGVKGSDLEFMTRQTFKWNGPNYSAPNGKGWAGFGTTSFQIPGWEPSEGPETERTGAGGPFFIELNGDADGPGFEVRGSVHYQKPCSWFTKPTHDGFFACPEDRCQWKNAICEVKPEPQSTDGFGDMVKKFSPKIAPEGHATLKRFGDMATDE